MTEIEAALQKLAARELAIYPSRLGDRVIQGEFAIYCGTGLEGGGRMTLNISETLIELAREVGP